ncbi:hypothetical protein [Arthrobacter sp. H35-D1]|uniref:hypothetical protein n=1 Tax=Arthrobacter sp. H35-D1 TaxID=3046202 RepID=UPI0024B8A599|nr:hypothetical protein [Arthrobacter sp. H35-D1]MDJ0315449.1 hypothetical protein [Arthrobacter sp. H35-D1]
MKYVFWLLRPLHAEAVDAGLMPGFDYNHDGAQARGCLRDARQQEEAGRGEDLEQDSDVRRFVEMGRNGRNMCRLCHLSGRQQEVLAGDF